MISRPGYGSWVTIPLREFDEMDKLDRARRSALMKRVRRENTAPELLVRRRLFALGYRFTLHAKELPGRPDIVFTRRKKVIFVHGCFWHGHNCRYGGLPKTNSEFWADKIARNRARDARKASELSSLGWSVLTLWQCEIHDELSLTEALQGFLGKAAS